LRAVNTDVPKTAQRLCLMLLIWISPIRAEEPGVFETRTSPFHQHLSAVLADAPRERMRSRVINWIKQRDAAAGMVTDILIPGSDLAVYFDIDPGGDEVTLEWDIRF